MLERISAPFWELQSRQWAQLKAPLRPSPEDVHIVEQAIGDWRDARGRAPRALVLGSTFELAALRWPERSQVVAIDRVHGMLRGVWFQAPPTSGIRRGVVGHWLDMPLADRCCDLVLGDGSFASVRPGDGRTLSRAIRRVLQDDGLVLLRFFVRPFPDEDPETVWADSMAGLIGSFAAFKLRLLMALQVQDGEVCVHEAWRFVHARIRSLEQLARDTGWGIEEVTTIEAYRDQPTSYWFPTLAEVRAALEEDFIEQSCCWPSDELADSCPTFLLAPRP